MHGNSPVVSIAVIRSSMRAALLAAALTLASSSASAQAGPDVIRGHVSDDSARALVGATIMVTRGPDRLTLPSTTDSAGNYRVRFDTGTGDYLVYVAATGFKSARRRVQRQGTEHELVADFTLSRDLTTLAAVKVTAEKPVRASNDVNPTQLETGASESWQNGVSGAVSPTTAGDLSAIAGTMSNVVIGPNGVSIAGSGAESNLTTLNGMGLSAGSIPRAAHTETRVTGATFDPTRGGFAGANIDVRLEPGSRDYQRRNGFVTLDPSALQFSDATSRALGNANAGARVSLGADGELIRQALTYNVALDVGRTTADPATLLTADADAFARAGVDRDSIARLIALAAPAGVPLGGSGLPNGRIHRAISWLGRLDDTRDTLATRALTSYLGYTDDGALNFGPLAAPSTSGQRKERTMGVQLTLGSYVGAGRRVLNETRFALSGVTTTVAPYRALPSASVLVRSPSLGAGEDITGVTLGGGSILTTDDSRWTAEGANETMWNAIGRRHRFKGSLWARADGLRQTGVSNQFGTFSYNSIADFAAGIPSTFARTLSEPARSGRTWNAATAIAHQYAPTRGFSVLYGARLESDGFVDRPPRNPALEQALGVRTGIAPARLHLSPRAGFSWLYSRSKENGSGTWQSPIGRFYRNQTGVIRGGIGDFRDLLRPGVLADATAATGLAGGSSYLTCVGSAVPAADWAAFSAGASSIPTQCLDGSGALGERAPAVTLIDPSYDVPHSWRASLDWSTNVRRFLFKLGGLASYDLAQPGTVDANFNGTQRLTLAGEGGRPVYVSAAGIDVASGAVSPAESRRSDQYGRVGMRVSDLRGYGGQVTTSLSPDVFKGFRGFNWFGAIGYTLGWSRRQYRGFDGAAYGDPRTIEWAPGSADARHVVTLSGGLGNGKIGTLTLFARAQSGLPFTPLVNGDVNGDGRGGDRAFILNPFYVNPGVAPDTALIREMRSLLASGSPTARSCVRSYLGHVAALNGCRGPWTQSLNIQWQPPMPNRWNGRVVPNVYFQNVLAGVDQLLHSNASLRGWGSPATPDPVLLVPRGFDAAAGRFRYDVNTRFADTRPGRTLLRDPFRIVIDFSLDLSTDFGLQKLRRAVEPVKTPNGWQRRSADSLAAFYLSRTSSIYKLLLEQSDSLFLTNSQIAELQRADSAFSARVRAIYAPLGDFLSRANGGAGKTELDSAEATEKAYWVAFWEQPEIADSIVTPTQRELIPMFRAMVNIPKEDRKHSQFMFGHPVTFVDKPK